MIDQSHAPQRVCFGIFEVDLRTGELWKSGRRLKLSNQPFSVLAILLERPGEVISREELQQRLWPDTFVDVDHNLNTAINKIRETLADSAERPRFVETLSRRGYRFIAPIGKEGRQVTALPADTLLPSRKQFRGEFRSQAQHSSRVRVEHGFWIAVLPWKLSDADADLADHADVLIEEIVTGLSHFSYLRVISLGSTLQYAGKPLDVRAAGEELRARYLIERQPSPHRRQGPRCRAASGLRLRRRPLG